MTDSKRMSTREIKDLVDREISEEQKLLESLEIPAYTERTLKASRVKSKDGRAITAENGWTALAPQEVADILEVGDPYIIENYRFNQVVGWLVNGKWFNRRSDQDIEREQTSWLMASKLRIKTYVDKNREDWTKREEALPDWLKAVMKSNRDAHADFETEPMGWGYTLVACELAAMYAKMGDEILDKDFRDIEDTDEINQFARENGTSGNQHGWALVVAKGYLQREKALDGFS